MFVKVTYAQTIELDEVFITNDQEEEELDDCDPDSDYYDECYCDPENCYGEDDEYYSYDPKEEELDDCHPDSDNYDEFYCYPENCVDPQTQEQENCNKTCPDSQTLNTVSCTCVNKPNKNWYQDLDGDGYHSATKSFYKSPGTGWKTTTLGPDCDDTKKFLTSDCSKVDWYYDFDGDGYYSQTINDYNVRKPEGDKWNKTSNKGIDCNDADSSKPYDSTSSVASKSTSAKSTDEGEVCDCGPGPEGEVNFTIEAINHYFSGNGAPVSIGAFGRTSFRSTPEYNRVLSRLQDGTANEKTFEGADVDMTNYVFHIGKSNFNYTTFCDEDNCTTTFEAITDDGFSDPLDLEGIFCRLPYGYAFPTELGVPYDYIPFEFEVTYPNPGYGIGEID